MLAVCNLGGASRESYPLGIPVEGDWELVLNTDDKSYEGAGNELATILHGVEEGWDGQPYSLRVNAPAMSVQWYRLKR